MPVDIADRKTWNRLKDNPEFRKALANGESLDRFETPEAAAQRATGGWSGKTYTEEERYANYTEVLEHLEKGKRTEQDKPVEKVESPVVYNGVELPAKHRPSALETFDLSRVGDRAYYLAAKKSGLLDDYYRELAAKEQVEAAKSANSDAARREAFLLAEKKRVKDEAAARERAALEAKLQQVGR